MEDAVAEGPKPVILMKQGTFSSSSPTMTSHLFSVAIGKGGNNRAAVFDNESPDAEEAEREVGVSGMPIEDCSG